MKTTRLFFAMLACAALMTACSKDKGGDPPYKGVEINGVRWAECNVAAFGKFAASPQDYGMFYQWNRKKAWPSTGETVDDWDSDNTGGAEGDVWESANDPCPKGWRLPTGGKNGATHDFTKLFDADKVDKEWVTTPVNGYKFTDKITGKSIFFPAAGGRYYDDGTRDDAGYYGGYWSSASSSTVGAWNLGFSRDGAGQSNDYRSYGFAVRCVLQE